MSWETSFSEMHSFWSLLAGLCNKSHQHVLIDAEAQKQRDGGWHMYLPLELRSGGARLSFAGGFCSSGKGAFHTERRRPESVSRAL